MVPSSYIGGVLNGEGNQVNEMYTVVTYHPVRQVISIHTVCSLDNLRPDITTLNISSVTSFIRHIGFALFITERISVRSRQAKHSNIYIAGSLINGENKS